MNRLTIPLISLILLCLVLAIPAQAGEVRVSIAGGYNEIESFEKDEVRYVSLSQLAGVLGGTLTWETVGHRISYREEGYRFEFLLDSPFFLMNDTTFNMTYSARLEEGQLFVPVVTFLPFLDRVTAPQITWDSDKRTITVESDYFNVTDMSVQQKANGLLIEIQLSQALAYEVFVTEGNWLNISIRDARVNRNRILSRKDNRYMYKLSVHQIENNTGQISMRLKTNIEKWHHKIENDPTRIQISISDTNVEWDTVAPRPEVGPDDKIDVIVIDPGHGGEDYGAVGPGGTREKDISLGIAKRLAKLIRKDKQFQVVMTRDQDKTVSLEKRAEIANDAGADLFISIHANASPKKHVRGWNVFFLAPALNDSARSVEQLENSFFLRESAEKSPGPSDASADPILSILNEMIMTEFQAESWDFAMMVDREFRRSIKTPARGIDQAGFFVLNKVFTPSVLIESAFISNEVEEKTLKSKKYQEKLAKSLYEAIKRFKAKYENR